MNANVAFTNPKQTHLPFFARETVNQTLGEPIKRKLRLAETALGTHGRSRVANARLRPNRRYVGYRTDHSHD
jgi:hypothetical protein